MDPPPVDRQAAEACNPVRIAMAKLFLRSNPSSQSRSARRGATGRRGAISVFAAFMVVIMLALTAFAVDIGMLCLARAELQRTADASALAATDELLHQLASQPGQAAQVIRSQSAVVQRAAVSTAR